MINANILLIAGVIVLGIWSLYKLNKEFSERLFFKIGSILFIIQGVANSYGLIPQLSISPAWFILTKLGSILFNFLLAYFFYWLMKKAPASLGGAGTTLSQKELTAYMEDLGNDKETKE
jgi:hypothetical protein